MTTSKFRDFQEDPCADSDFEVKGGDDCRTCTPNPDAFVPDWRHQEIGVPYKNEKTCQYCVVLVEDIDGKIVNADNIVSHLEIQQIIYADRAPSEEQPVMRELGDSMGYRLAALEIFLKEYKKVPPPVIEGPRETETPKTEEINSDALWKSDYGTPINTTEEFAQLYASIACEKAQLSTRQTISIGTPFKFLICVPCQEIDLLEDEPEVRDLSTFFADKQVVLDGRKLYAQLKRLSWTLSVFDRYVVGTADEFQIYEGKDNLSLFTPGLYGAGGDQNVFNFYDELKEFLRANDYNLGIGKAFKFDLAEEIKIIFDDSDPENPFVIKEVWAKKKYCDFVRLEKKENLLEKDSFANKTIMGYISKLNDIDNKLKSPTPVSWIDFLLDHTFPQLNISADGKEVNNLENAPVQSFFAASMDKTLSLFSTFMSDVVTDTFKNWSKNNCAAEVNGLGPEDDNKLLDIQEAKALWTEWSHSEDSYANIFRKKTYVNDIETESEDSWEIKTLRALGLCGTNALLDRAIRCLLQGMDLNEFLKLQASIYLKKLQPHAIKALSSSLPFSVAQEITDEFIKEMGDAPLPWQTAYPDPPPDGRKGPRVFKKKQIIKFYEAKNLLDKAYVAELQTESNKAEMEKLINERNAHWNESNVLQKELTEHRNNEPPPTTDSSPQDEINARMDWEVEDARLQKEVDKSNDLGNTANDAYNDLKQEVDNAPDHEAELEALIEEIGYENPLEFERDILLLESLEYQEQDDTLGELDEYLADDSDDAFDDEYADKLAEDLAKAEQKVEKRFRREKREAQDRRRREERKASLTQGTLYRPLPNLQAALTDAYVDQVLNAIGVDDLQRVLDNIPDYVPIGPIADALKCPWNSLFYPPVKRFLGSTELNTYFDCKESDNVKPPFLDVMYVNIKDAFTKNLQAAIRKAFQDAFLSLIMGLLRTALKLVDDAVCNLLGGLGANLLGAGDDGFLDTMADAFAKDPSQPGNPIRGLNRNNTKDTMDKVFENLGVTPNNCEDLTEEQLSKSYEDLYRAIGYALSVKEMKELFSYKIEEYDPLVLARIQQSISLYADCFDQVFNTPKAVGKFFRDVSSTIPLDKKNEIRQSIEETDALAPAITSICLTKQQYGDWLKARVDLLMGLGIPEGIATSNALGEDTDNANAAKTLLEAQADIDKFIADNMANEMSINDGPLFDDDGNLIDPSCKPSGNLLDYNSDEIEESASTVTGAYFDTIEMSFVKDLTTGGAWRTGLLDMIQANTNNQGFTTHNFWSNSWWTNKYHKGYESDLSEEKHDKADIFYPETIGQRYYEETAEDVEFNSALEIPPEERNTDTGDEWRPTTADPPPEPDMISVEGFPPVFTLEYEQDWDNFQTNRSKWLRKWTSFTDFFINEKDSISNFSIDGYKINNYRTYTNNLLGGEPKGSADPDINLELKQELDLSIHSYLNENFDLSNSQEFPFRAQVFNKYLKDSFKDIDVDLKLDMDQFFYSSSYGKTNENIYNTVKNMCYNTVDGEMSDGFNFGYDPDLTLTEENLNYVDPEPGSTEYTKRRKEKILGRAEDPNPRVHFLDPEKHGGSYVRPRLYIEPPRNLGWMGLRAGLIPEVDACEPARRVIINTKQIKDYIKEVTKKITRDPRLNNVSDCIKLIPFDLIVSQQSRAQLEGCIKAICRVYITESIIKTYPVFSSIFGGFSGNYDDSLFELIAEQIIEDLNGRKSRWSKKLISNKNYTNTFLEQCVEMYSRKYYSGELNPSKESLRALMRIEQSQIRYKYPSDSWFKDLFSGKVVMTQYPHREPTLENMPYPTHYDMPDEVAIVLWEKYFKNNDALWDLEKDLDEIKEKVQEKIIEDFYLNSLLYDDEGERIFLPQAEGTEPISVKVERPPGDLNLFVKKTNKYFRFFTRMYTVRTMRNEALILFKELLREEFQYVINSLVNTVDAKPEVFRVLQNFSTRQGVFYGNNTNYGTFDSVVESTLRGDIISIPNNISENLLDNAGMSAESIEKIMTHGCFVIQKYFRIIEKEAPAPGDTSWVSNWNVMKNRGIDLFNMVNPESFLEFIKNPLPEDVEFSFDDSLLISDLFGDLELIMGLEGQMYVDGIIVDPETGEEAPPIPEGTPEEDIIPIGIKGSVGIRKGLRLLYIPNEEQYNKILEENPNLARMKQQIEEQDYSITQEGFSEQNYAGLEQSFLSQKAYITSPYVDENNAAHPLTGLCIPITSVEIEEFDQEIVNLENFSDDDYKCLLDKLVETDEYKMLFDYCFPVLPYVGHNMIHTHNSFYLSIGQGEGERIEQDQWIGKDKPNTPRNGQPDDDIIEALDDTKDTLRNVFANIYTSEDFEKTFEFDFDKDFAGLKISLDLALPALRIGGHKNVRRPFDKDGNECESPMGKLFGGK